MSHLYKAQADAAEVVAPEGDLAPLLDRITARSTRDRITRPLPPKRWLWHGYIGEGELAFLHGMGGLSKSLLAQALMVRRGGFLLDRPVAPGRTLYLDAENDDAIIDDRLRRLGVTADASGIDVRTIEPGTLAEAHDRGLLDDLLVWLITDAAADLAVFDSWSALWGKDEVDHALTQEWWNAHNRVRRTAACTVLVVGHDNRRNEYRGLAVTHNAVQARLHLKPTRETEAEDGGPVSDLTLWHEKQRAGPLLPRLPFRVEWPPHGLVLKPAGEHTGALEHIVQLVRAAGGGIVPTRDLAAAVGVDRSWLNRRVDMLHACGLERDDEAEPRQSSGWRDTLVQSDPPLAQRSTMRVPDLVQVTPQTRAQRSTMRVPDLVQAVPPTGEGKTPVGTRGRGSSSAAPEPTPPTVDQVLDLAEALDWPKVYAGMRQAGGSAEEWATWKVRAVARRPGVVTAAEAWAQLRGEAGR